MRLDAISIYLCEINVQRILSSRSERFKQKRPNCWESKVLGFTSLDISQSNLCSPQVWGKQNWTKNWKHNRLVSSLDLGVLRVRSHWIMLEENVYSSNVDNSLF